MKRLQPAIALAATLLSFITPAHAFCGFYVARADAKLFNKASKVVVARSGRRSVVTMASDYEGAPSDFAMVIPVPTVIAKRQIKVTSNTLVDKLDAFSAPRLVEYHDPDPCRPRVAAGMLTVASADTGARAMRSRAEAIGVKIEAKYTVGEYDILILSAKQSGGLATWLKQSGYKMPASAEPVLASYIKQGMKFFVAKVNLKKQKRTGFRFLRPIQVAYDTDRFMLPIRLGTVNARGPQDMFVFFLTDKGRVETTNYRTKKLPSNLDVPIFTKAKFGEFYRAMFDKQVKDDGMRHVYLEYAWDMATCDPCAGQPLLATELIELGASWLSSAKVQTTQRIWRPSGNAFITRLHLRYSAATHPDDLKFQVTWNRKQFQGRYVLRHPFTGEAKCAAADAYRVKLQERFQREADTLQQLTGWSMPKIRSQMARDWFGSKSGGTQP